MGDRFDKLMDTVLWGPQYHTKKAVEAVVGAPAKAKKAVKKKVKSVLPGCATLGCTRAKGTNKCKRCGNRII